MEKLVPSGAARMPPVLIMDRQAPVVDARHLRIPTH
jgi:hypothetical protein